MPVLQCCLDSPKTGLPVVIPEGSGGRRREGRGRRRGREGGRKGEGERERGEGGEEGRGRRERGEGRGRQVES